MSIFCAHCGKTAEVRDARSKYCSKLCRGRAKEARIKANPASAEKRVASRRRADTARHGRDREKRNTRSREYYAENIDEQRRQARARYFANREKRLAQKTRWVRENRDRYREQMRRGSLRYIARKREALVVDFTQKQLEARLSFCGDRCWICATPDWTHWDHVKPLSKGGAHTLSNLRPACGGCNRSKGARWYGVAGLSALAAAVRNRDSLPDTLVFDVTEKGFDLASLAIL